MNTIKIKKKHRKKYIHKFGYHYVKEELDVYRYRGNKVDVFHPMGDEDWHSIKIKHLKN